MDPTYAAVTPAKAQDVLQLAVSNRDALSRLPLKEALGREVFWTDVIRVHALMRSGSLRGPQTAQDLSKALGKGSYSTIQQALSSSLPGGSTVRGVLGGSDKWLLRQLEAGTYPWLGGGKAETQRIPGYHSVSSQRSSMEKLFGPGSPLLREMKQRVTWIQNTPFESSRIGAWLRIAEGEGKQTALKDTVRWRTTAGLEDLYVTGPEVNRARALAQLTGDWSGVWKAYAKHSGPGDVRDIMDVMKANQSYARQLGLLKTRNNQYFGLSVDFATRIFKLTERGANLKGALAHKEAHVALLDAARDEGYLVQRATTMAATMNEVAKGTEEGKALMNMARQKRGPMFQAVKFFSAMEYFQKDLQEANLVQRLGRAFEDFATQGVSMQHAGHKLVRSEMVSNTGQRTIGHLGVPGKREAIFEVGELLQFLKGTGQYEGLDIDRVSGKMIEQMVNKGGLSYQDGIGKVINENLLRGAARDYTDQIVDRKMSFAINRIANAPGGVTGWFESLGEEVPLAARRSAVGKLFENASLKRAGWMAAGVAASMVAVGTMAKGFRGPQKSTPSLRTMDYESWLAYQREFSGQEDFTAPGKGKAEGGIAASLRRAFTDFGSPYRGPWSSQRVLVEQELLRERERYRREAFGVIHHHPDVGLFSRIKTLMPSKRVSSLITSGIERADLNKYSGIKGDGLFEVNLKDGGWKLTVDDADTITIQRGKLFGDRYSFRLSGIDAPETRHGKQAGQPYSQEATEKLKALLRERESLKLVFDPQNVTYGRAVGVLVADGQNINMELVRRGKVAALAYGPASERMLDAGPMASLEKRAREAEAGMWNEPFWQAYEDTLRGQRLTFNQIASMSRVAKSSTMTSAVSLMKQAQAQGFYSNYQMTAASEISERIKTAGIEDDYRFPLQHSSRNAPHNNYMLEMQSDLGSWIKTKGGKAQNKFSHKQGIDRLNKHLSLDSMGSSTSVWNRRRLHAFDIYGSRSAQRKKGQAALQRGMNETMFDSPIGHHRW